MLFRPLFLLSLPRSGSTLAQRVLATHPKISTASEPWLLLPYVYAMRSRGIRAEYWHETAAEAVEDFGTQLSGGHERYRAALAEFVLGLYQASADAGAAYFLDKSPHYHALVDDLPRLFPDAKFVILWRNPLAALSSMLATFRESRFEPYIFNFDVYDGIANLARFATERSDVVHTARYEDLVGPDRERHWANVFRYLELDFDPSMLDNFSQVALRGRYGDPTKNQFSAITSETVEKWKSSLASPVRKAWCRRWLRWIGAERLGVMGYDLDGLTAELDAIPSGGSTPIDLFHLASSRASAQLRAAALAYPDSPRPLSGDYRPSSSA